MDRIETNMLDGLAAAAAGVKGKPYLGSTDVVDQLVRDFLAFSISVNEQFQTGAINATAASEKLMELSQRYANIFLGESKAYMAMPWNSPRRLEFFLRAKKPPHLEDHARATDAYFACHGTAAIMLAMRADKHELTEAEVQEELTMMRNGMVRALLGIEWAEHVRASEAA
ncbi:hypothetical protein [Variovorax sp. YR566]|uniref:hypothetical protein n=1 Tax=Variovorax sp. YR566 TaxID=3450237 RepID=UPI003F80F443